MKWEQGQHLTLIGATGTGKSTLAREILRLRRYVLVLLSKPDPLVWPLTWKQVQKASSIDLEIGTHWRLRPTYEDQAEQFYRAFNLAWESGGWTIYIDELLYITDLKLDKMVRKLLTQGRSMGITVVCGIQRPVSVPRFALSEPLHIMAARMGDQRDVKVVGEIVGDQYVQATEQLRPYQFAWINKSSQQITLLNKNNVQSVFGGVNGLQSV